MAKKRCPVCSKRFSRRFCTSRHEDVCTRCCGIMRSKTECPRDCEFAAKMVDKGTLKTISFICLEGIFYRKVPFRD